MKMSIGKLIFETFYILTIMVGGVGFGIFLSRSGIEYLNRKAGFMINAFHETTMNSEGFYEIVPIVPSNPSDLR